MVISKTFFNWHVDTSLIYHAEPLPEKVYFHKPNKDIERNASLVQEGCAYLLWHYNQWMCSLSLVYTHLKNSKKFATGV